MGYDPSTDPRNKKSYQRKKAKWAEKVGPRPPDPRLGHKWEELKGEAAKVEGQRQLAKDIIAAGGTTQKGDRLFRELISQAGDTDKARRVLNDVNFSLGGGPEGAWWNEPREDIDLPKRNILGSTTKPKTPPEAGGSRRGWGTARSSWNTLQSKGWGGASSKKTKKPKKTGW